MKKLLWFIPAFCGFYMDYLYSLDNFSAFRVNIHDRMFDTAEHAYQFSKFVYPREELEALPSSVRVRVEEAKRCISRAASAHDAKRFGKEFSDVRHPAWEKNKRAVMKRILLAKLKQHPYVEKTLRRTKGLYVFEKSPVDSEWGWGPDLDGLNMLGELWMEIRMEKLGIPAVPRPSGIGWQVFRMAHRLQRVLAKAA